MKKLYILVTALCFFNGLSAQVINFPDAVLKNILISTNCVDNNNDGIADSDADTNNDNEIDYNEASVINNLYLDGNISSLEGLESNNFSGLKNLSIKNTSLAKISLSYFGSLKILKINNNSQLKSLLLTYLTSLSTLDCSNNQLNFIKRDNTNNIANVNCSYNNLTTLYFSDTNALTNLNCSNNNISTLFLNRLYNVFSSLEFNNNLNLNSICAYQSDISLIQNKLAEYGISNVTVVNSCALPPCAAGAICFDDENFKNSILGNTTIDLNFDGEIQFSEALQVTKMSIASNVKSINTIKYFTNLKSLTIVSTQIVETIDLTSLVNLEDLTVEWNSSFSTLKIDNLVNLKTLNINNNHNLSGLYANGLTNLSSVKCNINQYLSVFQMKNASNLLTIDCSNNAITSLDLLNGTNIKSIKCSNNNITYLNTGSTTNLIDLNFSGNKITTFTFLPFVNLQTLNFSANPISIFDLTGLNNLQKLECQSAKLSKVDVSYLPNLKELNCGYNNILTDIFIKNNNPNQDLTALNIIGNLNLKHICADIIDFNVIQKSIDLSGLNNVLLDSSCSCVGACSDAIINIPDPIFKAKLLSATNQNYVARNLSGSYFKIDANNDKEIQLSEAFNVYSLTLNESNISSLLGIEYFVNVGVLDCYFNKIKLLNVSNLSKLAYIQCQGNGLTSLNISGLTKIQRLICSSNSLTSLDLSNLTELTHLDCSANQLSSLMIKNGIDEDRLYITPNPNLKYICADESQIAAIQSQLLAGNIKDCNVNSYCTFKPGGKFYAIKGNNRLDLNNNGCDNGDIKFQNMKVNIANQTITNSSASDENGDYNYYVKSGSYDVTPILENPAYFNVYPITVKVTFPTESSPFTQDFCITANGVHPDLEVVLLPLEPARPGFNATYKIIYKNKGNTTQSGSVNLSFDDVVLDFVIAKPVPATNSFNNLSWNFVNLLPYETREIKFTVNANSPTEKPALNIGDILKFKTTIAGAVTDETPIDNTFTLNQTVVGSYDPNDKTCLEGTVITPSLIGEYVHYMIRFENTGTYAAQNIVVKDMIDLSKFDISSLIPTSSSHSFVIKISEGNKVEFIFENINLPFDDANNDGYIAFKIKTKPTLKVGDTFENEANIYFDYNFPILTNKATSKFETTLGTQDFVFSNYFTLYPNPSSDILNINATKDIEIKSLTIYDILGQVVIAVPNAQTVSNIDVSKLKTGNYFIKIKSDKGSSSIKFIKK
ncbi:Internalin-related protein [Flavobacterium aquidurense]|uniref:Internalin-related protein n=1 Tax=Flavobacterium aquidurense TaxID=362413 RepID=A0A0N8VNJ0_9FLAO|nr:Internalin-related protein [Flavobacterium aquidurense]